MSDGRREMVTGFGDRLIAGLQKRAVVRPTRWALEYVRTPDGKPMSFRRFPWQKEMLDSDAPHNCAVKGAQLGISHIALIRGMCANDMEKRDVLYVLPSMHPLGSDFSSARFDPLVAVSPHLSDIYDRSNVGHKRTATNSFYIRGAQSKAGGKSVPAGVLIIDEIDEVPKAFIPLVRERMSGQDRKLEWDISTPTIPEHGISKLWEESTQEFFYFPCPGCSQNGKPKLIHLSYPDCLEIVGDDPDSTSLLRDSFLKCPECGTKLPHETKAELFRDARFVPTFSGKDKRGFHVNQLYSATVTPGEFAAAAVRAKFSEVDAQEFWNSKLGKAHAPDGSKLNDAVINQCRANHVNDAPPSDAYVVRTMGVDVGSRIHYEVDEWWIDAQQGNDVNSYAVPTVLRCGWLQGFDQLDQLMDEFRINMCVIDAMPETRMAFAFSQRWVGHVKMCYYAQGITGKMLQESNWAHGEPIINVNRTSWLDQSLGRFKAKKIKIPADVPYEYVEHLKTPARIWTRDKHENPIVSYKTPDGKADHHAHARNYAEIALPLAVGVGGHVEIANPWS